MLPPTSEYFINVSKCLLKSALHSSSKWCNEFVNMRMKWRYPNTKYRVIELTRGRQTLHFKA